MICLTQTQPGRLLPFQTLDLLFLSVWVSAGCQHQSDAKQMKANLSASCISDITGGSCQFQMLGLSWVRKLWSDQQHQLEVEEEGRQSRRAGDIIDNHDQLDLEYDDDDDDDDIT